jgi:hypothetical protein
VFKVILTSPRLVNEEKSNLYDIQNKIALTEVTVVDDDNPGIF